MSGAVEFDFTFFYMGGTAYRLTPRTERAKQKIAELACQGLAIESSVYPGSFRVEAITMANHGIGGEFARYHITEADRPLTL